MRHTRLVLALLIPVICALAYFPGASAASGQQHLLFKSNGTDTTAAGTGGQRDQMRSTGTVNGSGHATLIGHETMNCSARICTALDTNVRRAGTCAATYGSQTMMAGSGSLVLQTVGMRCTTAGGHDLEQGMLTISGGSGAYAQAHGGGDYVIHFSPSSGHFHREIGAGLAPEETFVLCIAAFFEYAFSASARDFFATNCFSNPLFS